MALERTVVSIFVLYHYYSISKKISTMHNCVNQTACMQMHAVSLSRQSKYSTIPINLLRSSSFFNYCDSLLPSIIVQVIMEYSRMSVRVRAAAGIKTYDRDLGG